MRKALFILFAVFFLSQPVTFGEKALIPPDIEAKVDKDKIRIGDRIKLEVVAKDKKGLDVSLPEKPDDLGAFSLISSAPIKKGFFGKETIGREYILSIYTTGSHEIPSVPVGYKRTGGTDWIMAESPKVMIEVQSVLKGDETDIKDIKGLILYRSKTLLFLVLIMIVALILLLFFFRKRLKESFRIRKVAVKPAYIIAYEELEALREMHLPEAGKIKEYYIRLSDIVRRYIENRFSYKAPEMTTEEFLSSIKNSTKIQKESKEFLKEFLSRSDMVKFAKYSSTLPEMEKSFVLAEEFIDRTKPVEQKGENR